MTSKYRIFVACVMLLGSVACHEHHDHDHDHGHAHAAKEEEGPSLAITRWTDRYELFVELPAPTSNKPVPYHAHVTRLSDFAPATEGSFMVRFKTSSGVAKEATQVGVKRPGIFVFESPAPGAGTYQLEMAYEHGGRTDVFDCGSVVVADKPTAPEVEEPGGAITFLKEAQWKIPFGTAWAAERPMARELELPAVVEPAAGDQLTVGAPTGGRFFHNPKLALAEGTRIKKGDVLGNIAPNVAGDDYSRLQFAVEEARLAVEQTQREIARVEPLVQQGLLPERRLLELWRVSSLPAAAWGECRRRAEPAVYPSGPRSKASSPRSRRPTASLWRRERPWFESAVPSTCGCARASLPNQPHASWIPARSRCA
jgi:hypothetical protein